MDLFRARTMVDNLLSWCGSVRAGQGLIAGAFFVYLVGEEDARPALVDQLRARRCGVKKTDEKRTFESQKRWQLRWR